MIFTWYVGHRGDVSLTMLKQLLTSLIANVLGNFCAGSKIELRSNNVSRKIRKILDSYRFKRVWMGFNFFQPSCFIPPSARPTQLLESGTCLDLCTNLRSVDQQLWMRFLQRWKPLGEDVTHKVVNLTGLSPTLARGLPGTLSRCLLEDLVWISAEDAHPACQMRGNRC